MSTFKENILKQSRLIFSKILITIKYLTKNGLLCTTDQIFINLFNPNSERNGLEYGLTRKKRNPKLIVSLTSFPERINTVCYGLISLLSQSLKPDLLILWLAESQFPRREKDLPKSILKLKKYGLEISWCQDIRSYKKLIPTLKRYPDDIIVTADDDNIYDKKWLQLLYLAYIKDSTCIQCHRVTKFYYDELIDGFHAVAGGYDYYKNPSYLNKLTGLGGVLYPPHCFYKDILKEDLFMRLAPTNDDIWFWFMSVLKGVRTNVVLGNIAKPNYIERTQEGLCLCHINDKGENLFWVHINNMFQYYPILKDVLKQEWYLVNN